MGIIEEKQLFNKSCINHHANTTKDPSISVKTRRKSLVYIDFILQDRNQPFIVDTCIRKNIFYPPFVFALRKSNSRRRRFLKKSTLITPCFGLTSGVIGK